MRALDDPTLMRAAGLVALGLLFQFAEPLSLSGQGPEREDVRTRVEAPAGGAASVRVVATVRFLPGVAQEARALERLVLRLRHEGRVAPSGPAPDVRIQEGGVVGEIRRTPTGARITLAHLGN